MGYGQDLLQQVGTSAATSATGAIMEQVGYGLGNITGYNQALRNDQLEQQKALNQQQQGFDFAAMDKQRDIQMNIFDHTFNKQSEWNSAKEQMKRYKEAGLNPALMYSQGNAGMAGGTTASVGMGMGAAKASDESARRQNNIAAQGMALQLAKLKSEINVNESVANANNANAKKAGEETTTISESRQALIEKLNQEGFGKYLENVEGNWKLTGSTEIGFSFDGSGKGATVLVNKDAYIGQQAINAILQAKADIGDTNASAYLQNEKAKVVYQEMLNGIIHAKADEARATAQKLATDYQVGDYMNWKQILEAGIETAGAIGDIGLKGAKTSMTNTMNKKIK